MKKIYTFLLTAVVSMVGLSAFAGNNNPTTKYFRATAITTHSMEGQVYVAAANNTTPAYADTVSVDANESANGAANHDFYYYAEAKTGFKFVGWATTPTMDSAAVYASTNNPYTRRMSSSAEAEENPATDTLYAFFEEATEFYSSLVSATVSGQGLVSVSDTANSTEFADAMSDTILNSAYTEHTYYLQAKPVDAAFSRFAGWYLAADSSSLSTNAKYTYKVTSASTDPTAPTAFAVFAKFDTIPYYSSKVVAHAVGEGGVGVMLTNADPEAFLAEATNQNLHNTATSHRYYLRAKANDVDFVDFLGWYSDATCDTLLSLSANYTYNVTATSLDSLTPSLFEVYAKFESRNPYQFKNASFEHWNSNRNEPAPGWNGPASAIGSMAGFASGSAPAPRRVAGRTGEYAVELHSASVMSVNANGNLSTGIMNMGSMTASASSNNNHTVIGDPAHSLIILGQPDSLVYYSKFKKGQAGNGQDPDYIASAKVYLHAETNNFQDPVLPAQDEFLMALCYTPAPESEDWIRNAGAFEYYDAKGWTVDSIAEQTIYVLCDLTTNPNPGASQKDTLVIDDIRFIYNSELATATFAGDTLAFENGAANVNSEYSEDSLLLVSNARNAAIETEFDVTTALLTVTVKGNDVEFNPENKHVYTIQFVPATATSFESLEAAPEVKKVMINGQLYILRGEQMFDALGRQIR